MPTAGSPRVGLRPGVSLVPGESPPTSFAFIKYPASTDDDATLYPRKGLYPYGEYIRRANNSQIASSYLFLTDDPVPTSPKRPLVGAGALAASARRFRHLLRRIEVSPDGVDRVRARAIHEAPKPHAFPVRFVDGPEVVPYASGDTTVRFSHRNKKVRF